MMRRLNDTDEDGRDCGKNQVRTLNG
jgi:hypothetical protein